MTERELLEAVRCTFGNGFLLAADRQGWAYQCTECGNTSANGTGTHLPDCRIGTTLMKIDEYFEDK